MTKSAKKKYRIKTKEQDAKTKFDLLNCELFYISPAFSNILTIF